MPHGIVSDTVQETETLVSEIVISMDPHCVISDRIKCAKSLGIMIDTELEIQRLIMLIKANYHACIISITTSFTVNLAIT